MRFPSARALAFALLSSAFAASIANAANLGEVNLYSYRQPYLIDPLKEFTDETGIKVNVIFGKKGLIERIQAEGRNSPADVVGGAIRDSFNASLTLHNMILAGNTAQAAGGAISMISRGNRTGRSTTKWMTR